MRSRIAIVAAAVALACVAPIWAQLGTDPSVQAGDRRHVSTTVRTPISVFVDSAVGINADVVSWMIGQPEVLLAAARELDPNAKATNAVGEVQVSVEGHNVPCHVEVKSTEVREFKGRTILSGNVEVNLGPTFEEVPLKEWEHLVATLRQDGQRLTGLLASRLKDSLTQIETKQLAAARLRADRVAALSGSFSNQMRVNIEQTLAKLAEMGLGTQPDSVLEQSIGELTKRKLALELERAGLQARNQALQDQTRVAAKEVDQSAQADEIAQNYQKVLELQSQRLQSLRAAHQSGRLGQDEVSRGEIDLATATVELAKAQRAAANPRVQQLELLNAELASTTVRTAECEAKLKFVTERLEESLSRWRLENGAGEKLRVEVSDLQKRANLAEEENRRSHVEGVLLQPKGDVQVEIFSNSSGR